MAIYRSITHVKKEHDIPLSRPNHDDYKWIISCAPKFTGEMSFIKDNYLISPVVIGEYLDICLDNGNIQKYEFCKQFLRTL